MKRVKITLPKGGIRHSLSGASYNVSAGSTYELEAKEIVIEGDVSLTQAPAARIPFDLDAAKAGAPLVTRDGRRVHFVAHDPGADINFRLLVRFDDNVCATAVHESGCSQVKEMHGDIFMAPKPKRTVWVNLYKDGTYSEWPTDTEAKVSAKSIPGSYIVAIAYPIEIDD